MDVEFIEVREASGNYAVGQKVAVFRSPDDSTFELSKSDVRIRLNNRRKFKRAVGQEWTALIALT